MNGIVLLDDFLTGFRVEPGLKRIDSKPSCVVPFQREAINYIATASLPEDGCSSTRRPRVTFLVLFVVDVVAETTLSYVKVYTVQRHQLREEHLFNSCLRIAHSVAEDEAATLGGMAVQVNVHEKFALGVFVEDRSLCSVNCRMSDWIWLGVDSVEVETLSVVPPVPSRYTIWVQQWNELEDEVLEEQIGLDAELREKIEDALQEEGGACLTAVDSRADEDRWFIE